MLMLMSATRALHAVCRCRRHFRAAFAATLFIIDRDARNVKVATLMRYSAAPCYIDICR